MPLLIKEIHTLNGLRYGHVVHVLLLHINRAVPMDFLPYYRDLPPPSLLCLGRRVHPCTSDNFIMFGSTCRCGYAALAMVDL